MMIHSKARNNQISPIRGSRYPPEIRRNHLSILTAGIILLIERANPTNIMVPQGTTVLMAFLSATPKSIRVTKPANDMMEFSKCSLLPKIHINSTAARTMIDSFCLRFIGPSTISLLVACSFMVHPHRLDQVYKGTRLPGSIPPASRCRRPANLGTI